MDEVRHDLPPRYRDAILSYDLYIQELVGYSDGDIRDMFVRMNRFVVKLSRQEIRHAKDKGKFFDYAEEVGKWKVWRGRRIFTDHQIRRMRQIEFAAELAILIVEGPQDKKQAVDLYYGRFAPRFPQRATVIKRLKDYFAWIDKALPEFSKSRFRKPVDLYSLIGALELVTAEGRHLGKLVPRRTGRALQDFERLTQANEPKGRAARYLAAASRQTDNLTPRNTRIELLTEVIRGA